MPVFSSLLFPLDFSDDCRALVPYVIRVAQRLSSKLTLLHAFDSNVQFTAELGPFAEPMENLRKLEEARLLDFANEHFHDVGQLSTLLKDGDPATVIHDVVQQYGIDLVMMPTKGRGTFRRLLLGSVTAKVLHDVSCPVWTGVHASLGEPASHAPWNSILCAVGLDSETPQILKAAAGFARAFDAKLSVIHIVETPPMSFEVDFAPLRKKLMDNADLELRGMMREAGVEAGLVVLDGPIAARVRQEALSQGADLLIVGRGRDQGKVERLFSQLYELVREAPCPVVSI